MTLFAIALAAAITTSPSHPLKSAQDGQGWPLTRAERTNYLETSHYEDVIAFLEALQKKGAPVSLQYIGTSKEGHAMPLMIAARPMVHSAAEAKKSGKPIIYIEGNIHAGEVEGKEAAMIVLRRLCQAKPGGLLDKVILLVDPIYNIDGNERFGPQARNRPEQNGPELVGTRASGEGFDLNRDGIKAESLEFRALLANVWTTWDPDVMLDLHTTDGTRHGYELTYAPPLNPNTEPAIMAFTRDELLPKIRHDIRQHNGLELFDYGDVVTRDKKQRWVTFEEGGRYMTNYAGLRNRIGILSEATTYIPFADRVLITDRFVTAVLEYVAANAERVVELTRGADAHVVGWGEQPSTAPPLGLAFSMASRGSEEVILEPEPAAGKPRPTGRPKELVKVTMPVFDRFAPVKTASFPSAYFIPDTETKLVELLRRHGIVVEKLTAVCPAWSRRFTVKEAKVADRPFQGHRLVQLNGTFESVREYYRPGTYVVRTAQPLGILAFNILEPESTDGAVTWGFIEESPKVGDVYPVEKSLEPVHLAAVKVP